MRARRVRELHTSLLLVLLSGRVASVVSVTAFDCASHPLPLQMVKPGGGSATYQLWKLDMVTGQYDTVHEVVLDQAVDPDQGNPGEMRPSSRPPARLIYGQLN